MVQSYGNILLSITVGLKLLWEFESRSKDRTQKLTPIFKVLLGVESLVLVFKLAILGGKIFGGHDLGGYQLAQLLILSLQPARVHSLQPITISTI